MRLLHEIVVLIPLDWFFVDQLKGDLTAFVTCKVFPVINFRSLEVSGLVGSQSLGFVTNPPSSSALLLHKKQRDTMTSSKRTWDSSEFRQYASYMSTYIVPHHTPGSVEPISWNEINGLLRNSNRLFCFAFSSPSKRLNEIASHQVDISTILLL